MGEQVSVRVRGIEVMNLKSQEPAAPARNGLLDAQP
jgi:hypothetical protein